MNVRKIIQRFATAPDDPGELRRMARALGRELPRAKVTALRGFRAALAPMRGASDATCSRAAFASGYMACMLDVTAEVETALGQVQDANETERVAREEGWAATLALLADGPAKAAAVVEQVSGDHSSEARLLERMRTAGVVEALSGDEFERTSRRHRLTWTGRRLLQRLAPARTQDILLGIRLAFELLGHAKKQAPCTEPELRAVAEDMVGSAEVASHAIREWTDIATREGALATGASQGERGPAVADAATGLTAAPQVSSHTPWQRVPQVLERMAPGPDADEVALYVRTTDDAWPAWVFALTQEQSRQRSRTIVDGDLLTRSIQPPEQPFHLVYDHPDAIDSDAADPHMRELMARAEQKFVVHDPDAELGDVPGDFIRIPMARAASEGGAA